MSILRNPFALRNGEIITIEDLTENDRGINCNCICPSCKAPFEARLGKRRTHHFAHTGAGCSEETAYIHGLFLLLKEFVESGNPICLPALSFFFNASTRITFDETNLLDHIGFEFLHSYDTVVNCMPKKKVYFDQAELIFKSDRPSVLVLSKKESKLAVVVKPPASVCKETIPKKYRDLATVVLDLQDYDYELTGSKKEEIFQFLQTDRLFRWLYSPKVLNYVDEANRKNDEYKAYCREREEKRKEEQKKRVEKATIEFNNSPVMEPVRVSFHQPELPRISGREIIAIKRMDFSQREIIRDSSGKRWIECRKCQRKLREDKAYQIENDTNYGLCNECK